MKKIVIIGGGFAGVTAAKLLEKEFEVTLIDRKDYFEFTPSVLRLAAEPKHIEKIRVAHKSYFERSEIIIGSVSKVDNNVYIGQKKIGFDYLIVTAGAKYGAFSVKGSYDSTDSELMISLKDKIKEAKKILVVGGGLVGVELAAELPKDKVILVHSGQRLIERNSEKSSNIVEKYLRKRGVEIIYGERVVDKNKDYVTDKGRKIKADLCFSCIGIKANTDFLDKKWLDERGLKVNEFLQVSENVFAAGDITSMKEEKTAQSAEKQGKLIAENIFRKEKGLEMKKYTVKKRPMLISLGSYNGVLESGSLVLSGPITALMKWFVEFKTMVKLR